MAVETATVTPGYRVEVTSTGWGHLHHATCDQWTSFLDPTDERIRWYMVTHRCGEPGSAWHERELTHDEHRSESPGATAGWLRSVSRHIGTRPVDLFYEASVWPAMQELAHTLADLFPDAFIGAERQRPVSATQTLRRGASRRWSTGE